MKKILSFAGIGLLTTMAAAAWARSPEPAYTWEQENYRPQYVQTVDDHRDQYPDRDSRQFRDRDDRYRNQERYRARRERPIDHDDDRR